VDLKVKPGEIYVADEPRGKKADCTLTLDDVDMVALVCIFLKRAFPIFHVSYLTSFFYSIGYWQTRCAKSLYAR